MTPENVKLRNPHRVELLRAQVEFQRRRAEALGHLADMRRLREELVAKTQEMRHLTETARAAAAWARSPGWHLADVPQPPASPTSHEAVPGDGEISALTPRELEVLRLIAERHSTKEIAGILGISFKTAVCHRTHVMEKLGIHEVAGLVRAAIRNHLIEP